MRKTGRLRLGTMIALTLLATSGAAFAQPAPSPSADAALVERGRYLGEVVTACGACHNTFGEGLRPLPGMTLAGGRVFQDPAFRAVAPNITPDPETGIGAWTDVQIAEAIRNGRRPDGSLIGPVMPVEAYRGISDGDLAALIAWLRTVPPVRHAVAERSRFSFELTPYGPPVASVPDPPADDPVERGRYIAENLAHCMECHSTQLGAGRTDPDRRGAPGLVVLGPWGAVQARNISSHPEHGISRWTDEQVLAAITRGVAADGRRLTPPMAARAPVWARMTPRDQADLLAYLRSLPPQE